MIHFPFPASCEKVDGRSGLKGAALSAQTKNQPSGQLLTPCTRLERLSPGTPRRRCRARKPCSTSAEVEIPAHKLKRGQLNGASLTLGARDARGGSPLALISELFNWDGEQWTVRDDILVDALGAELKTAGIGVIENTNIGENPVIVQIQVIPLVGGDI